jgi:hypothetical protein
VPDGRVRPSYLVRPRLLTCGSMGVSVFLGQLSIVSQLFGQLGIVRRRLFRSLRLNEVDIDLRAKSGEAWQVPLQQKVKAYSSCVVASATVFSRTFVVADAMCSELWPIHSRLHFTMGIATAVYALYVLQLIYYKVLLYVVFGSSPPKSVSR